MIATEINILPWYTALAFQHHQKWYAYGQYYCLPTPAGFLIPFQLRRSQTGAAITALSITEVSTGTTTDILAVAQASGLEVVQYVADGYDLVIFPATLSVGSFNVGRHYLTMSDGTNTWYSEVFNFVDTTAGLVKVEWWHDGDFCYPSGRVRYNYPYKGRVYLKTDIGKPEYTFEQVVSERNGKNFKLKQISAKQYKFLFLAPEYLIDAFRQIPLHDFVEITNYNDVTRTYTVDEINMGNPDWQDRGDLAAVVVDFQTDTVIVKSGTGVTTLEYAVGAGECIAVDYTAVARIIENSIQYNGDYYTNGDGDDVDFEDEDYVLVVDFASPYLLQLYKWVTGAYILQLPAEDEIVYDANGGNYYFYDSGEGQFITPKVDSISLGVLTGRTFPNTLNAVYSYNGTTATLLGTFTATQIEAGASITLPGDTEFVYFVVQTPACPAMAMSNYFRSGASLFGVGYDTVEDDLIVY